MSVDDNTNESENQTEQSSQAAETETVSQSTEEDTSQTAGAGAAQNAVGNALASVLKLKESNPKVFFGGVGAIVVVILVLLLTGGSDTKLPVHKAATIVPGQNYVLKSANAYDPSATVRLVSVPGSMAAYDDTEEADREGACKHMPQGTPVKAIRTQDAYGKKDTFVEVEITEGECKGQRGWALSIDIQ
ncbi:MAG: hypothetical protein ACU836_18330 [Gammaproteobacteria bacterium]